MEAYKYLAALVIVSALFIGGYIALEHEYSKGVEAGKASCVAKQATAQVNHNNTTKANNDKIDAQTPNLGDNAAVREFLLKHVSRNGN